MFNLDIESFVVKGFYFKLILMYVINSLFCLVMMFILVCFCVLFYLYFIKNDSLLYEIYIVFIIKFSFGIFIK